MNRSKKRSWLPAVVAVAIAVGCTSGQDEPASPQITSEAATAETTTTTTETTTTTVTPSEAVAEVWLELLDVITMGNTPQRREAIEALGDAVPPDTADVADLFFFDEQGLNANSNASYTEEAGQVLIADCAWTDPILTLVGEHTVGFKAVAVESGDDWQIESFEMVDRCIPMAAAKQAEEALRAYSREWDLAVNDYEVSDALRDLTANDEALEEVEFTFEFFEENGAVSIADITDHSVEALRVQASESGAKQILMSECIHVGPTGGTFVEDEDGNLVVDELLGDERNTQNRIETLMEWNPESERWLYAGVPSNVLNEEETCLLAPTDLGGTLL